MELQATCEKVEDKAWDLSPPLFDAEWYLKNADDLTIGTDEAASHYLSIGWAEGRNPCRFFDTAWYLATNLDTASACLNPLLHYISWGETEGRWPCRIFDPHWYSAEYGVPYGGGRA